MKAASGPTLHALQQLRQSSTYTADLCTAVMLGGDTNRHNALNLLPAALHQLQTRVQAAIAALEVAP
jgi:hypothetical protein